MAFLLDTCVWIDVERGALAAQAHTRGRPVRTRVQDLLLASQALQHGYRLLTRNQRDFADLPGLGLESYELDLHRM